ncbi:MAG: FkbM family methyltransferase [Candidatus Aenigmatarchaeota archaeon]
MIKNVRRKFFYFLRDVYLFCIFAKNIYIFINFLNFLKSLIFRQKKYRFYLNEEIYEFNYKKLIEHININYYYYLKYGKINTDVLDYLNFGIKFKNRVVLDVGAWIGDSILLFHKLGAKRIIAYEPIKENVEFANKIIKKFNINCKIYPYAVCKESGIMKFIVEESEYGYGELSLFKNKVNKPKEIKVKCICWKEVLEKSN